MALPAIPTDFIAHWPGTISGSTLVEETGNYPATITGTVTRAIGRVGEAALFNGSSSRAVTSIIGNDDPGSVSLFVKPTDLSEQFFFGDLDSNGASVSARLSLGILNGFYVINKGYGATYFSDNSSYAHNLEVGVETHIAYVVESNSRILIYENGLLVHDITPNYSVDSVYAPSAFYIGAGGAWAGSGVKDANGSLNRVRFYPRALSSDETKSLALERPKIPTNNIVAAYNFADMAAGIVPDSAPGATGAMDLTVTGGSFSKKGMRAGIGIKPGSTAAYLEGAITESFANGFTCSHNFKTDSPGSHVVLYSKRTNAVAVPDIQYYYIAGAGIRGGINGDAGQTIAAFTPIADQEYSVVVTVDGTSISCYIDGVFSGSVSASSTIGNTSSVHRLLTDTASGYSTPVVSSTRLYNATLSPAEIALLATERQATPTLGLVSHWTMDDVQGAALIDEMGAYNGTITGATQVAGQIGQGLYFVAASSHFVFTTRQTSGPTYAVSGFVKFDNLTSGRQTVFGDAPSDGNTNNTRIGFGINNSTWDLYIGNSATSLYSTNIAHNLSVGVFYHLTFVVDTSNVYVYVNGALANTWALGFNMTGTGTGMFSLGRAGQYDGVYFDGALDSVQLFQGAPDPIDILALANESPAYTVAGTVTESGSPVIRALRAYDSTTGSLIATDVSAADGTYSISLTSAGTIHVMAVGDTGEQTLVQGPVTVA